MKNILVAVLVSIPTFVVAWAFDDFAQERVVANVVVAAIPGLTMYFVERWQEGRAQGKAAARKSTDG